VSTRSNWAREAYLKKVFWKQENDFWLELEGASNLWLSLHTADPGLDGYQDDFEATYTPYTRVSVGFGESQWSFTAPDLMAPFGAAAFPESTQVAVEVITHLAAGVAISGNNRIGWLVELPAPMNVVLGYRPTFPGCGSDLLTWRAT